MKQKYMAGTLSVLLACMLWLIPALSGAEEGFRTQMPELLRFTQTMVSEEVGRDVFDQRMYPDTVNDGIDAQLRALIDDMAARAAAFLPERGVNVSAFMDAGACISRSGDSVLSFLVLAETSVESSLTYMEMDSLVYDMKTGRQLSLGDLFAADSPAWEILSREAGRQLSEAYPAEACDAQALAKLCSRESLEQADFTLGAARLTLSFRADALYPQKNTLLQVHVYYPEIRPLMTQYGQEQTDNSGYRMVALTYDDGPARKITRKVMDELRRYGAQATFFVVGRTLRRNHDTLSRIHNSKHSIQSHTYTHTDPWELTREAAFEEKEMLRAELSAITGLEPTMMRAPGGSENFYIRREIGYPLIHWSLASGDSGNPHADKIASRVIHNADDGDVILMHDINSKSPTYSRKVLEYFEENGYLCVTVEELFADAGIALEDQLVYFSPERIQVGPREDAD